jgi:putative sigma-54 modulation protein
MRVELTGRQVDISPVLRRLVVAKLAKLDRLLNDRAVSAQAVLTREKLRHRIEITLHARGERFLHSEGSAATWGSSLAETIRKLSHQAQTLKGKLQARQRRGVKGASIAQRPSTTRSDAIAGQPAGAARAKRESPMVVRAARQAIRLRSVADAAHGVDSAGDAIVVFRNTATAGICVLYRRRNGDLTLVETEM